MLRHLAEILKADMDSGVLEDPSKLRVDHVGLCDTLLDLLQWQLQQPPDENPSKHRGLINAWIAVLRGMARILLALEPAVGLNVDAVRPLVPKVKSMYVPAGIKAATDELLSTLQTICLGSAMASKAISHWEGVMAASRRSLRSDYGSDHGDIAFKDSENQGVRTAFNGTGPVDVAQNGSTSPSDSSTGSNVSNMNQGIGVHENIVIPSCGQ